MTYLEAMSLPKERSRPTTYGERRYMDLAFLQADSAALAAHLLDLLRRLERPGKLELQSCEDRLNELAVRRARELAPSRSKLRRTA